MKTHWWLYQIWQKAPQKAGTYTYTKSMWEPPPHHNMATHGVSACKICSLSMTFRTSCNVIMKMCVLNMFHIVHGLSCSAEHEHECILLTGGNWQKWKRVFLTCPCHEIYRDEAVVLKSCKYTWKITIFVKMWNLGQYHENLIFCE